MLPFMSYSVARGYLVTLVEWAWEAAVCYSYLSAEIMGDFAQDGLMKGQLALPNICEQACFCSVSCSGVLVSEKSLIEPPKTFNR